MSNTKAFELTIVSTAEMGAPPDLTALEEWLNDNIDLGDYGDCLDHIFVTFLWTGPEYEYHKAYLIYTQQKRQLELAIRVEVKPGEDLGDKDCLAAFCNRLETVDLVVDEFDFERLVEKIDFRLGRWRADTFPKY
jgi:hypothetical protein